MVFNYRIVLDQRSRIDDAVAAHPSAGIDDSAVHHNGACANGGVTRNMSGRRDDDGKSTSEIGGPLIEAYAICGRLNLAYRNQHIVIRFGEFRQITVRRHDGITEVQCVHFSWHTDQPDNLVAALLLDDIYTCMGVATGTDQYQAGLAHEPTGTKPELLGILINRRESDWALGRSIRGQSLKGVNSCIKIQAGRVIKPASLVAFNIESR